ncbi:MAG: AAA family ATPase, partial [Oscillospiraceae bacterium]
LDAGADCARVKIIDETDRALSMLDERIEQALIETGAKLLILDPIQSYVGPNVNMNTPNEVRNVMSSIGRLAEKYNCAIILIGHMNKGSAKSSYRGLGSIDFQAAARSVLIVGRLKDNEEIRVVAHGKSSLAPEGKPIAFELNKETGFNWLGHYDISIDELLSGIGKENKSELAEKLLLELLEDSPKKQSEILNRATSVGISKRVLDEAKKNLEIKSFKQGGVWYWKLP